MHEWEGLGGTLAQVPAAAARHRQQHACLDACILPVDDRSGGGIGMGGTEQGACGLPAPGMTADGAA
jgi:hypothetical protein